MDRNGYAQPGDPLYEILKATDRGPRFWQNSEHLQGDPDKIILWIEHHGRANHPWHYLTSVFDLLQAGRIDHALQVAKYGSGKYCRFDMAEEAIRLDSALTEQGFQEKALAFRVFLQENEIIGEYFLKSMGGYQEKPDIRAIEELFEWFRKLFEE